MLYARIRSYLFQQVNLQLKILEKRSDSRYLNIFISIKMFDIRTSNLIILLLDNGSNLIAYPKS